MSTAHKFTATLQLAASVPEIDHKASKRWSSRPIPEHCAEITFFAPDPPTALIRLHFVAQRLMRAYKSPDQKGAARRYGPADYTVTGMSSQNGSYDLPGSKNPDFSEAEVRRQYLDDERGRITPREFKFVPFPLPFAAVED